MAFRERQQCHQPVILDAFEVNEEVGERDLHAFLEALLKRKLIEIENG